MKKICRSALVPFSDEQMFDMVNDIESYSEFLPWCKSAEVFLDGYDPGIGGEVRAALTISRSRLVEKFETRNTLEFPSRIAMQLVKGPFKHLNGVWEFKALGELGCKIELTLDYELSRAVLDAVMSGVVKKTVNAIVDAFCQRANTLYG